MNEISIKIGIIFLEKIKFCGWKMKSCLGLNTSREESGKPVNSSYLVSGEQKILEIWKVRMGHHWKDEASLVGAPEAKESCTKI